MKPFDTFFILCLLQPNRQTGGQMFIEYYCTLVQLKRKRERITKCLKILFKFCLVLQYELFEYIQNSSLMSFIAYPTDRWTNIYKILLLISLVGKEGGTNYNMPQNLFQFCLVLRYNMNFLNIYTILNEKINCLQNSYATFIKFT